MLLKATWLQVPVADKRPANTFNADSRSSRLSGEIKPFLHNRTESVQREQFWQAKTKGDLIEWLQTTATKALA